MYHHGLEHDIPNAYILGEEVGGALVVGFRSGSGTLFFEDGGETELHWTTPRWAFSVYLQVYLEGLMSWQSSARLRVAGTVNQ